MLQTLFVKDFAIVGEAEIGFDDGLTVVTGETGAGKSLLVDALLLLAGNRADAGVIRHGRERAELIAEFSLADSQAARSWLTEEAFDDGEACQLRRVIRAEGASRAWINGRPATLTQLKALADKLIEIHGQHEHQALLEKSSQLALLDGFGGHAQALDDVARLAKQWRALDARMQALRAAEDHSAHAELLEHNLLELDRHALAPGELDMLNQTHLRLANAGQLIQGSSAIAELLDGDGEFVLLRLVARAQSELARLEQTDARLAPARELLDAASIQLGECNDLITRYRDALDLDPTRLDDAEKQIAKLHELSRKHRVSAAQLKAHADALRAELLSLRGAADELMVLQHQRTSIEREYVIAAQRLTDARVAAASRLGSQVTGSMDELGMRGGRFEIALEPVGTGPDGKVQPDAQGMERAEFMVSANAGQPQRALRKVASGGELSRISLAIEVAALGTIDDAASAAPGVAIPTMVFDEVDSGIGGAVAEVVGQKLRRLGHTCQVLCVTHLPQVAAQGHHHLRVAKSSDGANTETAIETLDDKSRRDEIARMLGGVEITRETVAHAKQMLASAGRE